MDLWTSLPLAIWAIPILLACILLMEILHYRVLVQIRDAQPAQDQQSLDYIRADLAALYTLIHRQNLARGNPTQPLHEQDTQLIPAVRG